MNRRTHFFLLALLGIAGAWVLPSVLRPKASVGRPIVPGIAKARLAMPELINPAPALPVEPQLAAVPIVDPPSPALQSPSAPEADPEQVAVWISSMGEAEVCAWLAKLADPDLTGNTGRLLLRRWVELDPAVAVNWVAQLGDAGARQESVDVVAVAWSEQDLPSALAWVEAMPEDDTKHQALADLGYEVARVDPVDALQIATQLPASDHANGMLLHALAQYASADPGQSQQLALALPPGPFQELALSTVVTVQARQDGAGAAQFAVENIPPGPGLDRAIMGVVQLWGQSSAADASAWVQSFPVSPIRDQALQTLGLMDSR